MPRIWGWLRRGAALGVLCTASTALGAPDLANQIAAGDLDGAAQAVADAATADDVAGDSAKLRAAAEALAEKAATPEKEAQVAALAAFLVKAGEAVVAQSPDDADAWWAIAEGRAAGGEAVIASGRKTGADVWFAVADAYDHCAKAAPPGDEPRLRCIRRLIESAGSVMTQGSSLVTRALGVAQEALKDPATVPETRVTYGRAVYEADRVLVERDKKAAREPVKAAYALLKPACEEEKTPYAVAWLWNDLVTFERTHRLAIGEDYITESAGFFSGRYTMDLPIGPRWKATGGATGGAEDDWGERREPNRIVRTGSDGNRVGWFWGQIFGFSWLFNSEEAKNPVGGDNPGAIADLAVARFSRVYFKKVDARKKPRRGKINRHLTGFAYELTGLGNNEKPFRIVGFTFRGDQQSSYGLVYCDECPVEGPDPELDAVVESLRERED